MSPDEDKGQLLEKLVAALHDLEGLTVQERVKLPSVKFPGAKRKSEIDVLLSTTIAGCPVRIAIQCRNRDSKVPVGYVREFLSVLDDVGIASDHGIIVSSSGFTGPAREWAKNHRVGLFLLEGLTADRLAVEVAEIIGSRVYVLGTWGIVQPLPDLSPDEVRGITPLRFELPRHYGNGMAAVLNRLWELWVSDHIPLRLGMAPIFLDAAEGFVLRPGMKPFSNGFVNVRLDISGLVATLPGTVENVRMRNVETGEIEKQRVKASFEVLESNVSLQGFPSEKDLESYLNSRGDRLDLGRIRVPRLVSTNTYWPPTEDAIERVRELTQAGREVSFEAVEGTDIGQAWNFGFDGPDSSTGDE